ncbi:unnamed protein product, partial [Phaeothamnion confervicola]
GDGAPQRFQEQLGMPKEEDLNSWSHHHTTDTVDDPVFRAALAGTGDSLVSFVFGLEVTWGLLQAQELADTERATIVAAATAEAAATAAGAKKGGDAASGVAAETEDAAVATPAAAGAAGKAANGKPRARTPAAGDAAVARAA